MKRCTTHLMVALCLSTCGLEGSAKHDGPPLCRVQVRLEPELAWVDQQVLYQLRIETRHDVRNVEWLIPPVLPGLRWERLPGNPDAGRVKHDGVEYHVREEHRALFPEQPGEIVLPSASLRCESPDEVEDVLVPETGLEVRTLPTAGRPAGFSGLVGKVGIVQRLQPRSSALGEPLADGAPEIGVGETLRLSVQLRGNGNLWDATAPLAIDPELGAAVEVFPLEPEQDLERGAALSTRRRFRYDIVPREPGRIRFPPLRLDYFDPETGSYAVALAPEILVTVDARAAAAAAAAAAGEMQSSSPPPRKAVEPAPTPDRRDWPGVAAVLVACLCLAVAGVALLGWRHVRRGSAPSPRLAGRDDAQESAAAAASRRLRQALHGHVDGLQNATPEEILETPDLPAEVREAARVLAAVERARFDPQSRGPEPGEIEQVVSRLAGRTARRSSR